MLAWALGVLPEMPPFWAVGDAPGWLRLRPPPDETAAFVAGAALRDDADVERELERAAFLNWRGRTERLRLQGFTPPAGDSFEAVVARAVADLDRERIDVEHDDADVLIGGDRLGDLGLDRKLELMSIAEQRHLALVWLRSDEPWDQTAAAT